MKNDASDNTPRIINSLLQLFLHTQSRKEYLDKSLQLICEWADVACGGIRVADKQGNIPYASQLGFSDRFIESENWLSTCQNNCACTRVILGKVEPQDVSQMTSAGSFCCNNTFEFINNLAENSKSRYRGVCIQDGFKSIAIIPIKYGRNILGAIHLADERENKFPPRVQEFLESSIASIIGEGIYRFNIEEQLQYNLKVQTILTSLLKQSLEELPQEEILNLTLELIHSIPSFSIKAKSCISIIGDEPDNLIIKAFKGFEGQIPDNFSRGTYNIPIQFRKNILGEINIFLPESYRKNNREQEFLTTIANTLAEIIWRRRSEDKLKTLSRRLVRIQEEERRSVALELHDQIGQMLTGLKLMINQAARISTNGSNKVLDEAQITISELIVKVREMSLNLRPSMLDDLGLLPTLIWHFEQCKSKSNLEVEFQHSGLEKQFTKEINIAAYRIVQEALTNIIRHAEVNRVKINVWTDDHTLHLEIQDQGKGFDTNEVSTSSTVGLQGMRERAILLGGNLVVYSKIGMGTTILAELPLQDQLEKEY